MKQRARIVQAIRDFFVVRGFLEVDTPLMAPVAGQEPHLAPFRTTLFDEKEKSFPAHLITSPEYACKKMLAAGYKKIFTIAKCFRNGEPWDALHNPEFTMIEWYRARADYRKIMNDVEALVVFVAQTFNAHNRANSNLPASVPPLAGRYGLGKSQISKIQLKNQISPELLTTHYSLLTHVDLTPPWPRVSVREAFRKYCGLELNELLTRSAMAKAVHARGYSVSPSDTFDDLFFKIFLIEIEPFLGQLLTTHYSLQTSKPVILYDYPAQMAALARKKPSDPRYAERFEVYIAGMELANAFSELTDAREQAARLVAEQRLRKKLGREVYPIDQDFLSAVRRMPPSAGIALGVDRLLMLLLDAKSIDEVVLFPASQLF